MGKCTILVLAANPLDSGRLSLDREVRSIEEGLRRSRMRDSFHLCNRLAVTHDDLRRGLLDESPQIVHFCGHGHTGGLVLDDGQGGAVFVKSQALKGLFKLFSSHIQCVVLNACYTEEQAEAIHEHVPIVIGMGAGIADEAAIHFATGFYDAVGAGRSFEDAFEFGKNAIDLPGLPDGCVPRIKKKN